MLNYFSSIRIVWNSARNHHELQKEHVMDGKNRKHIKPGIEVSIVLKKDQRTGTLTEGVVRDILTKSQFHPHGIKVRLENGEVGRVKVIKEGK